MEGANISREITDLETIQIEKKTINGNVTWEILERVRVVSEKVITREMAEAEVLRVVKKMDSFLIETKNIIDCGTRKIVERVREKLTLMPEFLADKKLEERSRLKHWICDVVEIARDVLLIINVANLAIQEGEDPECMRILFLKFDTIHEALNVTTKQILQLGVEGTNTSFLTFSSPWQGDEDVMGFEQEVNFVLHESILTGRQNFGVVCIVGMAGTGKTALARKVYNHPTFIERYELRVWVSVSSEMSNREVLMNLILQLLHNEDQSVLLEEMENADNQSLQDMIHQHLQDKQFLIVLDNISEIPYADTIYKVLRRGNAACRQSILMLTSRLRSTKYQAPEYPITIKSSTIEMKPLDDDQSWQLFLNLLRFHNQEFPKQLKQKGKEMLRKCDGLPLSIKEVATQFVTKRQEGSEWNELLESPESPNLSRTLTVLGSVYQRWPPKVKLRFLCLSFFEKGKPIRMEKLEQVWVAGQVIQEEEEEKEEDGPFYFMRNDYAGVHFVEGYKTTLKKLIEEYIIEVDIRKNKCIKCIRVNGSFHTLSMEKAKEEKVLKILKKGVNNPPSSVEPRYCAIYCSRDEFNHFTDHDERIVSLFFRGGSYFDVSESYWKRFKQLKTLDFEGFGLKMLPETIGALTELRYLGLRDNYIQELPHSLGHLKNLETLDIALNFMVEVPDILWEISSLCYLYMSDIICRKPLKIDTLKNLKTLTYISVDNWIYEVSNMKMMTSLRKLGIEDVDESMVASTLFASLSNLEKLDCLILRGFRFRSLPSLHGLETLNYLTELRLDGLITKLPSADVFPPRLRYLSLINSSLDEDPMPELARLRNLMYLKLKNAYTGQQMVITTDWGFPLLRVLFIEELWHLRKIEAIGNNGFWPAKLEIKSCPFLENIPEHLIYGFECCPFVGDILEKFSNAIEW